MARVLAVLRLLYSLTRRDHRCLSTLATNNLFFCLAFLAIGDAKPRHAFWSTLFLQLILLIPVLFATAIDTLSRVPRERELTWPLSRAQRLLLAFARLLINPVLWLLAIIFGLWGGIAAAIFILALAALIQIVVLLADALRGSRSLPIDRLVPRVPGPLGGLIQIQLRHILRTLDLYAALLLSLSASLYRFLAKSPDPHAFPVMAVLVAIALSTFAQRAFALDAPSGLTRYRLLPIAPWKLLAAKDAALLLVVTLLVLPLNLRAGLAFTLVSIAIGRFPSLHPITPEQPWRFLAGNIRFGIVQLLFGCLFALAILRLTVWFLPLAALAWLACLATGHHWWHHPITTRSRRLTFHNKPTPTA